MSALVCWLLGGIAAVLTLVAVLVRLALHADDDRPPPGHEYGDPTISNNKGNTGD